MNTDTLREHCSKIGKIRSLEKKAAAIRNLARARELGRFGGWTKGKKRGKRAKKHSVSA